MTIVPDVKLDVRGERCPYPRIRTLQEIKNTVNYSWSGLKRKQPLGRERSIT